MLHLIQSNKMEALEAQLIELISQPNPVEASYFNPLLPQTILVQSPGMAQWLKIEIADHLGIAANLEFPLPSSYIWQLYQHYFQDLPDRSAFTKPSMTWKLMAILPTMLEKPLFAQLRDYLQDDSGLKRYLLCQKIADVYDQYQMYRPQWLLDWEQGIDEAEDLVLGQHQWQPELWRQLVAKTVELGESVYHRANLHQMLLSQLRNDSTLAKQGPLYIFGLSAIPRQQLEVFDALGAHMQVYIFWCNPSQHYWGDIIDNKQKARLTVKVQSESGLAEQNEYFDIGNPLLSSWGKLGRDYQEMLLKLDVQQHDLFIDAPANNLLSHLQSEVLNLTMRGSESALSAGELLSNGSAFPKIELQQNDSSLVIHSCHSKTRELEVLHNYLLDQFNREPSLSPGDVIVMIPDVAQYAPYIDGVFGAAQNELFIPYAISDRNAADESTIIESFLQLVSAHQSRLGVTELLAILDVPAVQNKFSISPAQLEDIRFWLQDANVRWGWDEQDKQRWDVPDDGQNTWLFGLNRLLAGYALNGGSLYHHQQGVIAPYRDIEGQAALALGKLYRFSLILSKVLDYCQQTADIESKVDGALQIIEQIYAVDDKELIYVNQLRQAIEEIGNHASQYADPIDQDIFVSQLKQVLQEKGVGQRFLAGYVNFCTLMPMRSIPFRQVCLLGMNDGDYPRQTLPVGFDLMRQSPVRQGDRSRRLDDRYLFLEAILCAREQLYLSYQGMSGKDNSERNPSVLLSELLDYCQHTYCLQGQLALKPELTQKNLRNHLITVHPLQPFSEQYFAGTDSSLSSYVQHWLDVAKMQQHSDRLDAFLAAPLAQQEEENGVLELDQLVNAWSNPAKHLFTQRWRTSLNIYLQSVQEHEPFDLDPLSRFSFVQRILDGCITTQGNVADNAQHVVERLRAEGALPLAEKGEIVAQQLTEISTQLLENVEFFTSSQGPQKQEVDLSFDTLRLVGWIEGVYGENLVMCRAGKLRAKDKLRLWIHWLCLCACARQGLERAYFVCTDRNYALAALDPVQAKSELAKLLQGYQQMSQQALYCYPESAFNWVKTADKSKTLQTFAGSGWQAGEGDEPHIARICPDLDGVFEQFISACDTIYAPIADFEVKL